MVVIDNDISFRIINYKEIYFWSRVDALTRQNINKTLSQGSCVKKVFGQIHIRILILEV